MPIISNSKIELVPAGLSLASGRLDNAELKGTGGTNSAVGSTYETISQVGGIVGQLSDSGEVVTVVSSDAGDFNAGGATGARRVRVRGIDENGNEVQEDFALNGTTSVTGSQTFRAINQVFTLNMGNNNTTGANLGDITVKNAAETATVGKVVAGENRMYQAQWSKPDAKNVYITSFMYGSVNPAEISIWLRKGTGQTFQKMLAVVTDGGTNTYKLYNPFLLSDAGATIQFRAKKLDTADAKVSVDFQLIQET